MEIDVRSEVSVGRLCFWADKDMEFVLAHSPSRQLSNMAEQDMLSARSRGRQRIDEDVQSGILLDEIQRCLD